MSGAKRLPPAGPRWLLERLLDPASEDPFLGDLDEEFRWKAAEAGPRRARLWYLGQALKSLPFILKNNLYWRCVMFLNSLKSAWRGARRRPANFFINNTGLAVGLAVCILIFLWVRDELAFDRFHENRNSLYIAYTTVQYSSGQRGIFTTSYFPLARALKSECPEAAEAIRYASEGGLAVRRGEKAFFDEQIAFADAAFFDVFTFRFLEGNARTALDDKTAVVVTATTARRYFGSEDPIGKILNVADQADLHVTAVIADPPGNSSLQFGLVVPFAYFYGGRGQPEPEHWGGNPLQTFVLLHDGVRPGEAEKTMTGILNRRAGFPKGMTVSLGLHPLTRFHLHDIGGGGRIRMVVLFAIVALFVLVLACVNFVNLATAGASVRTKEVGMRKVVGAGRPDLIRQFLQESVLASLLSFLTALVLVALTLPAFNALTGKRLSLALLGSPVAAAGILAIVLSSALLAGGYPAFVLASIRPLKLFKGGPSRDPGRPGVRKALVVIQYAVSVVLLAGILIVHEQIEFMRTKDLGYKGGGLYAAYLPEAARPRFESFRNGLLSRASILGVTRSLQRPDFIGSTVTALDWDGKNPGEQITMSWDYVDFDYFETLEIKAVAGRTFSRDHPSDLTGAYVINQEAARLMGMDSPVGRRLSVFRKEGTIIGVVGNFHFQPLQNRIGPIVFGMNPDWRPDMRNLFVRVADGSLPASLRFVEEELKPLDPGRPVVLRSVDSILMDHYEAERRMEKIVGFFTMLALFISCLGMFALASFSADRRTKEIGIRKILGASPPRVAFLLAGDFVKSVAVANILALPVAYYAANRWLQGFAYRWRVSPWIFLLTAALTIAVALATVSLKSLKTASASPSRALRRE